MRFNLGAGGKTKSTFEAFDLARLHFVEIVITPNQQQPDGALDQFARIVVVIGGQHQRFRCARQGKSEQLSHFSAGRLSRRRGLCTRHPGQRSRVQKGDAFRQLDVGGVVAFRAIDDRVFTGIGDHLELLRHVAADGATVSGHGTVLQAHPVEDRAVGLEHGLIAAAAGFEVAIERVGVLHRELSAPHHTESRPSLVAKLGLDVIEIFRQGAVASKFLPRNVGDHLFAGGLDDEIAFVPVFDAQQFGPHLLEASGLLPQFGRLHHGHQQLHGAGPIHLLANDGFNSPNHAQAHGHVGVDARAEALDHAGANHQFVADHLSVGGCLFQRRNKELGGFHAVK